MKLTGKCKQDFEKWLLKNNHPSYNYAIENDDDTGIPTYEGRYFHYQDIYDFPFSMQYGVFEDFFNQTKVINDFFIFRTKSNKYSIVHSGIIQKEEWKTREEARTQAITTSNMIHNETNK